MSIEKEFLSLLHHFTNTVYSLSEKVNHTSQRNQSNEREIASLFKKAKVNLTQTLESLFQDLLSLQIQRISASRSKSRRKRSPGNESSAPDQKKLNFYESDNIIDKIRNAQRNRITINKIEMDEPEEEETDVIEEEPEGILEMEDTESSEEEVQESSYEEIEEYKPRKPMLRPKTSGSRKTRPKVQTRKPKMKSGFSRNESSVSVRNRTESSVGGRTRNESTLSVRSRKKPRKKSAKKSMETMLNDSSALQMYAESIPESGEIELTRNGIQTKEPLLDMCIGDDNVIYGCGEFGLREYQVNDNFEIEEQFSLIDEQVILDIHQDATGRLIYTNPEENSVYLIDNDDIIFISEFIVIMAGLNVRLNKAKDRLFFQNRDKYIANVYLQGESYTVERVYSFKELDSIVKFEADCVGSDIVALSTEGILKVSEKNLCYKVSTEKDQKFSSFSSSQDEKILVVSGTKKNESTGENVSTLYAWKAAKNGVLKKGGEFKIITDWSEEGYDVLIDVAVSFYDQEIGKYYIGAASLYTGFFFLLGLTRGGNISMMQKLRLREPSLQTFLLKFEHDSFWSTGDDNIINFITF